jgi:hypothetical protein
VVGSLVGLADRKGALVEGAGVVEVTLGVQDAGEVVEALSGERVVGCRCAVESGLMPRWCRGSARCRGGRTGHHPEFSAGSI